MKYRPVMALVNMCKLIFLTPEIKRETPLVKSVKAEEQTSF